MSNLGPSVDYTLWLSPSRQKPELNGQFTYRMRSISLVCVINYYQLVLGLPL